MVASVEDDLTTLKVKHVVFWAISGLHVFSLCQIPPLKYNYCEFKYQENVWWKMSLSPLKCRISIHHQFLRNFSSTRHIIEREMNM